MAIRTRPAGSLPSDLPAQRDASPWVSNANVSPSSDKKPRLYSGESFKTCIFFFSPADLKTQKKAMNHILLSVRSHASLRFLQINGSPAERVNFRSISNVTSAILASGQQGRSPGGPCTRIVFLSPGGQSSKPAMCACEMPLCIFRKCLRGRQPKYFY